MNETLCAKKAVFAGSAARFVRIPKTWTADAPPIQTITAAMWRKSQSSYRLTRKTLYRREDGTVPACGPR